MINFHKIVANGLIRLSQLCQIVLDNAELDDLSSVNDVTNILTVKSNSRFMIITTNSHL